MIDIDEAIRRAGLLDDDEPEKAPDLPPEDLKAAQEAAMKKLL